MILLRRHIAMLDHLAIDIKSRHGVLVSREGIIQAIVDAAMISGASADTLPWPESPTRGKRGSGRRGTWNYATHVRGT
jgi:hypothetical protein